MESTAFIHPTPHLARLNRRFLKISISLCIIILGFSLSTFGQFSVWITPATFLLCMAHNITLLVLSSEERNGKRPLTNNGKLPATATKASYICAFVLAFFWLAAIATLLVFCVELVSGESGDSGYFTIEPWIEWVLALFEVVVLIVFGVRARRERKAILGLEDSPGWWNMLSIVKKNSDDASLGA